MGMGMGTGTRWQEGRDAGSIHSPSPAGSPRRAAQSYGALEDRGIEDV